MSSQLMSGGVSIAVQIVIVVGLLTLAVTRAVIAYLYRRLCQLETTRRLEMILDGVEQDHLENVIRAFGELENGGKDQRD
jgi:hypothetical protein